MSFNFIDTGGKVSTSRLCVYDSNKGYEADFSENGNVSGWTLYDGIHTYGCWNNFLFGTLYGETSLIGRHDVFRSVEAELFYTIKLVMKLCIKERISNWKTPKHGKIAWTTLSDPNWSSDKEIEFDIITDNKWHTYYINMGEASWWQGDVHNLRIHPILQNGRDGDEFFIRVIGILSVDTYKCTNQICDYFSNYQHPCVGIGTRGTCASMPLDSSGLEKYTITKNVNDVLFVNVNDYGYETIKLQPVNNVPGATIAGMLIKEISKINIGGYDEVGVEYKDIGQFIIYSGTNTLDSTVTVGNTPGAVSLNFYDEFGNYQSTESVGQYPASGYKPKSSFKINTYQVLKLFDDDEDQEISLNPFVYNIEGGRRDWLSSGLGIPEKNISMINIDRDYRLVNNSNKTIIDFNHPFNANGRITKIYAALTLNDYVFDSNGRHSDASLPPLEDAEIMFFRPLKNGTIKVLNTTVPITNRDQSSGNLYSSIQEYIELNCDVFVNKGDFIGIYNAHVYKGKTVSGNEIDALFYQITGKAGGILDVGTPLGEGGSGLLIYARSDQTQSKLVLDIDLSKRLNIESVDVTGSTINEKLEYNIARCIDVNWTVDLFGGDHTTVHVDHTGAYYYNHPNVFYGKDCLVDGINIVSDGIAGTSFSTNLGSAHGTYDGALHKKDGGVGVIVNSPKYFHVNGDSEWVHLLNNYNLDDFKHDPVAFTLLFPGNKKKFLSKINIHFKEKWNFRSFALSFFKGEAYCLGTADDPSFDLIPYRIDDYNTPWSKLTLDGSVYEPENADKWSLLDLYLAHNPIIGYEILDYETDKSGIVVNNDQIIQSLYIDWLALTIEWPESEELGFRLYCDYHESTKICELELFCAVSDVDSSIVGSVSVAYSTYGDDLWLSETVQNLDNKVTAFVGDTPRYITVEIEPIIEMDITNIDINIGVGDVFLGKKGCQQHVLPITAKTGEEGDSFPIYFKNVYGENYRLYVDIVRDTLVDKNLLFYSRLNSENSVVNTEVGPDAYYKKSFDYPIVNNNYNVAINCPVYGLKNLVDGVDVWYTYDNRYSWQYWGKFSDTTEANFTNLPNASMTVLNIPVLKRSKWWKIGFLDQNISMKVTEIQLYYKDEQIQGVSFYHNKGQDYIIGGNTDTAPHLNNGVIDGSYYVLTGNQYIGIELPEIQEVDQIRIYHGFLEEYENTIDVAGVDRSTAFNLKGYGKLYQTDTIYDYSYYEHELEVVGSGIYCDNCENCVDTFVFTEDFSDCTSLVDWSTNTECGSVFTCSSGIPNEDWVYEFDIGITRGSDAAGYREAKIHELQYALLDQEWAFEFKFKFNLEYIQKYSGENYTEAGISVGVLNAHIFYSIHPICYFEGAQMLFGYNKFGIAIKTHWYDAYEDPDITTTGLVYGTTYYCIFASDGKGTYTARAWTDTWEGVDQVCNLTKVTSNKWTAGKIGVGSGWEFGYGTGRGKGWITGFDFTSSFIHKHNVFNDSSIKFSGNLNEHVKIDYDNSPTCNINRYGFNFNDKCFTIDTFIKFESLPTNMDNCVIVSCWKHGMIIGEGSKPGSSWALVLENISDTIKLRFYVVHNSVSSLVFDWDWNPDPHRWYHFYLCRGETVGESYSHYAYFVLDSHIIWYSYGQSLRWNVIDNTNNDIKIGKNFDGWLQEFRISSDDVPGGARILYYGTDNEGRFNRHVTPTRPFERYYTFQLYISEDNLYYGLYGNIDCMFDNSFSYHEPLSSFSQGYDTYFALDLGHRYNLGIVRSFPVDEAHIFNLTESILYSNKNTVDPSMAFELLNIGDVSTDFIGVDYSIPKNWFVFDGGINNYILNNKLFQQVKSDYVRLRSDFYLIGDFDFEIEYELVKNLDQEYWSNGIHIQDTNNSNNKVGFERSFYNGENSYRLMVKEDDPDWVVVTTSVAPHQKAIMRMIRNGQIFTTYIKAIDIIEDYTLVGVYEVDVDFGKEVVLEIITQSDFPNCPITIIEWNNLVFNFAVPVYSTYKDVRWVGIKMWNGDGTTRTIKRIGIYPDISEQLSPDGKYNTEWVSLGTSITNYVTESNVALNTEVESSSYVGLMVPENSVNGLLTSKLEQAWGSEEGTPQWITVKLPQEMQIYRVKLYLGYDELDDEHMIQDYEVQISNDNLTFETIFTVTDNDNHEMVHDLFDPVVASYVRIYITKYISKDIYIEDIDGYRYWAGANIRQIGIYEYYGSTFISSEDYPIISLNLKQNYFIRDHSMIGVDSASSDTDWDNSNSNYTYSNSNLDEPQKVTFGEWGQLPGYEKWVVIKRNTATHYPLVPDVDNPFTDTPDYLKHVIIQGAINEDGIKPNPIEHPWMWESNISVLNYNYEYVRGDYRRALEIKYPDSIQPDHIYFREGDDFGIDGSFSWRDNLEFYWYIDDINNLDLGYGYIYFGGYDSTDLHNPVIHKWYLTTLSGILHSGWNNLSLVMKEADEVEWTKAIDDAEADPKRLYVLTLQKLGMVFKGKGKSIIMYITGFMIRRNHFNTLNRFDYGLYLCDKDILKINVGELNLHSGTLEFFIRPDWNLNGRDIYKDFKFRSLFYFSNVVNDVFGAAISTRGLEIYYGNVVSDFNLLVIPSAVFNTIDQLIHMAFMFSNDGTGIDSDGSAIRVYINNIMVAKSFTKWKVSDEKHFNFVFGGQSLLIQKNQGGIITSSSVDGVVSNIRIFNYCKVDFTDSINFPEIKDVESLTKPSSLIEISKDNLTFYRVGSTELPIYYKKVSQNEIVPVYVRTIIPDDLVGKEKRTAEILGQWDIGV